MKGTISIKFVLALVLCLTILPISVFAEPFSASDGGPAPLPSLQSVSAFSTPSVQNLMSDPGFETSARGWNSPYGGAFPAAVNAQKPVPIPCGCGGVRKPGILLLLICIPLSSKTAPEPMP